MIELADGEDILIRTFWLRI